MGGLYKLIGMVVWFITSLAAINVGLTLFDMNVLASPYILSNMPWIIVPAYYVIGISGAISLIMMLIHTFKKCSKMKCD